MQGISLTEPMLASFFLFFLSWEFHLHILCWFLFSSEEFLLHIPCWLHFYLGSFSFTSLAGFIFIWGVSLTHPMLTSFLYGEFLLHIPCWLHFYQGNFSCTSRGDFFFMCGVSLAHPVLAFFDVRNFFPLQSPLKTISQEKSWLEAGQEKKCEKVTLKEEKEALEQPEQSRTKH